MYMYIHVLPVCFSLHEAKHFVMFLNDDLNSCYDDTQGINILIFSGKWTSEQSVV